MSSALIEAATTQNVAVPNIQNIKRCSESLVHALDYVSSAETAVLLKDWSVKWTGRRVLNDKFHELANVVGHIDLVKDGIRNGQVTEGLCQGVNPIPTRYIQLPFL